MKKIIFFFVCVFTTIAASAQDVIVKKDGGTILAKVVRVTTDVVKYKDFSDQSGSLKSINVSELLVINYEDGERETFSSVDAAKVTKETKSETDAVNHESAKPLPSDEELLKIYDELQNKSSKDIVPHTATQESTRSLTNNDEVVVLREGFEIPLEIRGRTKTSQINNGKTVDFYVSEDVVVEGITVIPAGTHVVGKVVINKYWVMSKLNGRNIEIKEF